MAILDIFADIEPVEEFDLKKDQVAAHLAALLSYSDLSRSEIANRLGWKASRVTKALSGNENLTLKTIFEFAQALGYDWDVIYKKKGSAAPRQPWNENDLIAAFQDANRSTWQLHASVLRERIALAEQQRLQQELAIQFSNNAANEEYEDESFSLAA